MKAFHIDLPDWFVHELHVKFGPNPDVNNVISLLLEDYLKRNAPIPESTAEAKLKEIRDAWTEHEQSKFKMDGSHFQADIKLNQLMKDIK